MFRRSGMAMAIVASLLGVAGMGGTPLVRSAPKPKPPATIKKPASAPKRWRPNFRGDGLDVERMEAAEAKRARKLGKRTR